MRSTNARKFLDTNILVYTDDRRAPEKEKIALALLEQCRSEATGVVSTQVLQEYFSTATSKLKIPPEVAKRKTKIFSRFKLVVLERKDIVAAIDLHQRHKIAFWDGLIIRAALRSRCSVLYSEDLQAGRRIDGMEIVNPFL